MNIEEFLTPIKATSQPVFFDLSNDKNIEKLKKLFNENKINHVVDEYNEQHRELFAIQNPPLVFSSDFNKKFEEYYKKLTKTNFIWRQGQWVYFPWISTLVHILNDKNFQLVRTARNRNLITEIEQEKFYNSTIGVAGLSVGNSIALAIILQGGARHIKLADHDALELSNTNRIRTSISSLGLPKVEMTARQIYLINPYTEIEIFYDGLTKNNISSFFDGLDIMIDEIDNLAVKYLIREKAKKNQLPVVMAADNDNSGVVDIERYDLDKDLEFFHGRLGKTSYKELNSLDKFGIGRTIAQHIGIENHTERMLSSLEAMGKSIASWPQLGGTALLNGAAVAYCVRRILNKQELEDNRAILSLDEKLDPIYFSKKSQEEHKKVIKQIRKRLKI